MGFIESTSNQGRPAPSNCSCVWYAVNARIVVQVILDQFFPQLTYGERQCGWLQNDSFIAHSTLTYIYEGCIRGLRGENYQRWNLTSVFARSLYL
jgi:hypothetical protein